MISKLWQKLRGKAYRKHFVEAQVKQQIPLQMRLMLRKSGWTQDELAERAELTQGAVSRALNMNYGNLTLNTIIRIASGFDVAFIGKFVPFSKLAEEFDKVSEEDLRIVATFDEEDAALEREAAVKADPAASLDADLTRIAAEQQRRAAKAKPSYQMSFDFDPHAGVVIQMPPSNAPEKGKDPNERSVSQNQRNQYDHAA